MFLRSLDPELFSKMASYKYIRPKVQNTVSNSFGQFRPVSAVSDVSARVSVSAEVSDFGQ